MLNARDDISTGDDERNDNDNDESDYNDDDDDDESYESEEDDGSGRTLLFLCEEGQLDIALKRVKQWDEQHPLPGTTPDSQNSQNSPAATHVAADAITEATIQRELFRKNLNTGNYCLHEILAGGTSGKSAPELVERLVRRYRNTPVASQQIFLAQPTVGSNGRTILHWCAWSKTTPKILRLVLGACPEAMCRRDSKSHFSRTPLGIAQRYWSDDEITKILKSSLDTYLPYRLRICVRLCAERLFLLPGDDNCKKAKKMGNHTSTKLANTRAKASTATERSTSQTPLEARRSLKPFDKKDRRIAGLAPRPWFVASVLGYALQREMKGLALRILSFVGCGAKLESKKGKKKKRKLRPNCTNKSNKPTESTGRTDSNERKKRKTR